MKTLSLTAALTAALLIVGCVPSLHPLYSESDVLFEPALVGTWIGEDGKQTWEFTKHEGGAYRLVFTDKNGREGRFQVHLTKIDGTMYLDLYPEKAEAPVNDFYRLHFVPAHSFVRLDQFEPTLQMSFPDVRWMKDFVKENPDAIGHEWVNDNVVLTAPTAALRDFVRDHKQTEGAFTEPMTLTRR